MAAPKFLHEQLDALFDNFRFVTLGAMKTGGDGATARIISPNGNPIGHVCLAISYLDKATRQQDCPTELAEIARSCVQILTDDLSGESGADARH